MGFDSLRGHQQKYKIRLFRILFLYLFVVNLLVKKIFYFIFIFTFKFFHLCITLLFLFIFYKTLYNIYRSKVFYIDACHVKILKKFFSRSRVENYITSRLAKMIGGVKYGQEKSQKKVS